MSTQEHEHDPFDDQMKSLFTGVAPADDFEDQLIARLRSAPRRRRRLSFPTIKLHPVVRNTAAAIAASIVVAAIGYVASEQIGAPSRYRAIRVAGDLRQLGQATSLYANDNNGAYPRVFTAPSSNAEKWDFGGGDNRALDWSTWNITAGARRGLSYSYQNPFPASEGQSAGFKFDRPLTSDSFVAGNKKLGTDLDGDGDMDVQLGRTVNGGSVGDVAKKQGNASNHDEDGKSVTYSGGQVALEQNPFSGVQRDNIFTTKPGPTTWQTGAVVADPFDRNDSVLTPGNDSTLREKRVQAREERKPDSVITRVYDVRDLAFKTPDFTDAPSFNLVTGGAASQPAGTVKDKTDALIKTLQDTVASNSWQANGGNVGSVKEVAGQLIVTQTAENQEAVGRLLEQLRTAQKPDDAARGTAPVTQPTAGEQVVPGLEGRAIIRTGTIELEIDSFDATFEHIKRLVTEDGGYVGAINSEKLPNGKVRGTIVLRCVPEKTDSLISKLRGLGEVKRQNLSAEEVTKQLADLNRQFETATTMQRRLSELSTSTTGPVKDKVNAEREAGEWRQKAEQMQSQIASLKNQVNFATITVILAEKGLDASSAVKESEAIDMGVETEDVEKSRVGASKAVEEAGGRIVESQLKQFDGGQLTARVIAEVAPDKAGSVSDRLKQLGKLARIDVQRQTATLNGQPPAPGSKVERKDTRIVLSLYNLANLTPRVVTTVNLACDDVEQAYRTIAERVGAANGRIIASNVNRQQVDGGGVASIQFELKSVDAEAALNDVRGAGEVMKLESTTSTDTNNVTSAKRGFSVALVSVNAAAPRQITTKSLAAADVSATYNALLDAARKAKARIVVSKLEQQSNQPANGWLDFEVRRDQQPAIETALASAGDVIGGNVTVSSDTQNTLESKVSYKLWIASDQTLPPREASMLAIETRDVDGATASVTKVAGDVGGRVLDATASKETSGRSTARLSLDVPLSRAAEVMDQVRSIGTVRASQSSKNPSAPGTPGKLARARVDVVLGSPDSIVQADAGVWFTIRNGLSTSAAGLMWSLRLIVIGLCLIAPWALVIWGGWKVTRRLWKRAPITA